MNARKATLCATLDEVRRVSWPKGDVGAIIATVRTEADLLGLNGPIRVKVDVERFVRQRAETMGLDPEEVLGEMRKMQAERWEAPNA